MLRFDILSLFPDALEAYYTSSILGRAQKNKLITIMNHDLRKWANDKHKRVDDTPYGGGPGMVIRVDVVHRVLKALVKKKSRTTRIILLAPSGETYDQRVAKRMMKYKRIVLIAGRYEAVDARIERYVDEIISIGNFVLTGGELAAACIIDSVSRLQPGVLGKEASLDQESFSHFSSEGASIEYPQFTRPEVYQRDRVPKVLLSGNHGKIAAWRHQKTGRRRIM